MAKLEEWSLPKPEFHISNPVITKVIRIIIHCLPKLGDENKEIEAENGPFSTITCMKLNRFCSSDRTQPLVWCECTASRMSFTRETVISKSAFWFPLKVFVCCCCLSSFICVCFIFMHVRTLTPFVSLSTNVPAASLHNYPKYLNLLSSSRTFLKMSLQLMTLLRAFALFDTFI